MYVLAKNNTTPWGKSLEVQKKKPKWDAEFDNFDIMLFRKENQFQ